jgi:hypothetical protein
MNFTEHIEGAGIDKIEHPIYLVKRGECSFVTKVRNIARAGGKLAIIIDTENESIDKIVMSDDGTGAGIRIPSIMIGNNDGSKLVAYISMAEFEDLKDIELNIHFVNPHPQDVVDLEVWYTSADDRSMAFLKNIGHFLKPLENDVKFKPRSVSWSCPNCDEAYKKAQCFGDGKYCAVTKEQFSSVVPGKDILLEDIREQCLYELFVN